jgi:hypothetical protein
MVQERYNTEWILKNQVGIVIRNFCEIDKAVARMADEEQLPRFRARVGMLDNRAVFEIPDLLDEIMAIQHPYPPQPQFTHLSDPANLYE